MSILHRDRTGFLIKNVPFLSSLSDEDLGHISDILVERQYVKNQTILYEEDTSNYFYIIYSGKVKVVQLSADGRERILAIHKKGEYFGEMSFLDGKTLPATIIAMEETRIGLISRHHFERFLMSNELVLKEIIRMLCSRLRESWLMIKVMSFADAEQRVRVILKNMGDHFGIKEHRGTIINIRLTHSDIAKLASISRETATRVVNRLENSEEIEVLEGKHILIKKDFSEQMDLL